MAAVAAPLIMFVAPGPMDEVQAECRESTVSLRKAESGVYHGLFVSGLAIRQVFAIFVQRLTETGDVAVPKIYRKWMVSVDEFYHRVH